MLPEQSAFCCPVCMRALMRSERSLRCEAGHCFDLARQGYVNLLRSNQSKEKRHGDDKMMVAARKDFLDGGYYGNLLGAACELLLPRLSDGARILDVGCGECYYTAGLLHALQAAGKTARVSGVDISRDALILGARRERRISLAVASAAALPVADHSQNVVLNFFAPLHVQEFARVLAPEGLLLRAIVLEEHLMGLKEAVYEKPIPNPPPETALEGFRLIERRDVREELRLEDPAQIANLFRMTPYYYKTGRTDQEKLDALRELSTPLAFALLLYESETK